MLSHFRRSLHLYTNIRCVVERLVCAFKITTFKWQQDHRILWSSDAEKQVRHKFYIWIELFYRCVTSYTYINGYECLCIFIWVEPSSNSGSHSNPIVRHTDFFFYYGNKLLLFTAVFYSIDIFNLFELVCLCAVRLLFYFFIQFIFRSLCLFVTPFRSFSVRLCVFLFLLPRY